MIILGIDVGYKMTKVISNDDYSDIFMSTYEGGTNDINKGAINIVYAGNEYTIGEKTGTFTTEMNKINDLNFRLCMFTAIARAIKTTAPTEVEIVTGLPIDYYNDQKEELRDSLTNLKVQMIYKGKPRTFVITKCTVFPQSAGLFTLYPERFKGKNIVVDIGGLTVDAAYFDGMKLLKRRTYELGLLKLYDTIIQKIKKFNVSYDLLEAEDIIETKQIIKDGKPINVRMILDDILEKHTAEIIRNVKNGLKQYDTSMRTFMGGGSEVLKDYIPEDAAIEDIFTNARAFYEIGVRQNEG